MKKIYSAICVAVMAVVFSFSSQANNLEFEGVLGMNLSTINNDGIRFRPGFHAGVRAIYQIPSVTQGFYVNATTLLSFKGFKTDSISFNPFYLDIPIHAGYRYDFDERYAAFVEAGPYVGIGLFGKSQGKDIFSDEVGYKRLDVGVGLRGGLVFRQKVSISLGADFGFIEVLDRYYKAKPRNIALSFGYKF